MNKQTNKKAILMMNRKELIEGVKSEMDFLEHCREMASVYERYDELEDEIDCINCLERICELLSKFMIASVHSDKESMRYFRHAVNLVYKNFPSDDLSVRMAVSMIYGITLNAVDFADLGRIFQIGLPQPTGESWSVKSYVMDNIISQARQVMDHWHESGVFETIFRDVMKQYPEGASDYE